MNYLYVCVLATCLGSSFAQFYINVTDLTVDNELPSGDRIGIRDVTDQVEALGGCVGRLQIGLRLVLAREDVTKWKAMYFHEIPADWEGEGLPPISSLAEVYSEKLELKDNQSPVMAIIGTTELNNNYIGLWKLRSRIGLPDQEELMYLIADAADELSGGRMYDLTWYQD